MKLLQTRLELLRLLVGYQVQAMWHPGSPMPLVYDVTSLFRASTIREHHIHNPKIHRRKYSC